MAKREPEPIRGAVRAAQATIDEQLSLIEAGRFERAHVVHKEQVQTPFHQLEESAENCATGDPSGALELLGDLEAEFGRVRPALEVETVRSRG